MREKLRLLNGQRIRVTARIERFGEKPAFRGPPIKTILLRRVVYGEQEVTDHLWMTAGKWSEGLQPGHIVAFNARVTIYAKGYKGRREDVWDAPIERDYRLSRPTKVQVMAGRDNPQLAMFQE